MNTRGGYGTSLRSILVNQVECWFSILSRHVLARGSFTSTDDLAAKIDAHVAWYLQTERPFRWSYLPESWSSQPSRRPRPRQRPWRHESGGTSAERR